MPPDGDKREGDIHPKTTKFQSYTPTPTIQKMRIEKVFFSSGIGDLYNKYMKRVFLKTVKKLTVPRFKIYQT